jgi:hypothetical protein
MFGLFSTHPATKDRIAAMKKVKITRWFSVAQKFLIFVGVKITR